MVLGPEDYLSILMGADGISDSELTDLGVQILEGVGTRLRKLLIPGGSLPAYKALVRERLAPGYWNEMVGRQEILFIFKLEDGTVKELALSEATRPEIARLCSLLNEEPLEKTSDVLRYLAGSAFYRDVIEAFHLPARE